jgi:hypothetical protein
MSKIPLPERGQPLDLSYIYEVAKAVNSLAEDVSPSTYKYVSVDSPMSGKHNAKATEVRIIGGYKQVINGGTVSSGNEKPFSYDFGIDFKYEPIVIATPINITGTAAGKDVIVILNPPTTSKVDGVVKFNTNGEATVAVNLMILGIPS